MTTPTPPDMPELKSCPFCGEAPEVTRFKAAGVYNTSVQCKNRCCVVQMPNFKGSAAEKWNTRPTPPADAQREALPDCPFTDEEMQDVIDCINLDKDEEEICDCLAEACKWAVEYYFAHRAALTSPAQAQVDVEGLKRQMYIKLTGRDDWNVGTAMAQECATIRSTINHITAHYHLTPKTQNGGSDVL